MQKLASGITFSTQVMENWLDVQKLGSGLMFSIQVVENWLDNGTWPCVII